jgi:hypothetical protein
MDKFESKFLAPGAAIDISADGIVEVMTEFRRAAVLIEQQAAALKTAEDLITKRDEQIRDAERVIELQQEQMNRDAATIIRQRNMIHHWQGNHADIVKRKALLEQRPDLPVDRIPAMREMESLQNRLTEAETRNALQQQAIEQKNEALRLLGADLQQQNRMVDMLVATPASSQCWCHACSTREYRISHVILCPACGNKRCPKANDHRNECAGSNATGQPGSAYP